MTAIISEIDVFEALDFDPSIECSCCERTAEWVYAMKCCDYSALVCDVHRLRVIKIINDLLISGTKLFSCSACYASFGAVTSWTEMFTFTEIQ